MIKIAKTISVNVVIIATYIPINQLELEKATAWCL